MSLSVRRLMLDIDPWPIKHPDFAVISFRMQNNAASIQPSSFGLCPRPATRATSR
jgi:hypothetical protein